MAQLKRYNGSSWEVVGGSIAPKTTTTLSDTDTYSCNYVNDQLTDINGDISNIESNVDSFSSYSTNETVIGTWFGETLYRKVITGNLASGDLQLDLSSLNIKEMVNSYGRCGATGNYRPLNFYLDGYYVSTRYSGGAMYIAASSAYAGEPFKLVIEYTKN